MKRFEEPDHRFGGHPRWRLEIWKIWKSDSSLDRRQNRTILNSFKSFMGFIDTGQPSVNDYSFKSFIALELVTRKFIGLNDLKSWENTSIGPQWTQMLLTL